MSLYTFSPANANGFHCNLPRTWRGYGRGDTSCHAWPRTVLVTVIGWRGRHGRQTMPSPGVGGLGFLARATLSNSVVISCHPTEGQGCALRGVLDHLVLDEPDPSAGGRGLGCTFPPVAAQRQNTFQHPRSLLGVLAQVNRRQTFAGHLAHMDITRIAKYVLKLRSPFE